MACRSARGTEIGLGTGTSGNPAASYCPTRMGADMTLVRISSVQPLDHHRVQLTLTDGRVIERDLVADVERSGLFRNQQR